MAKEVKDGLFNELEEKLQARVINSYNLIKDILEEMIKEEKFYYLKHDENSMSKIDEFLTMPTGNSKVGSVRVYRNKGKYSCMIQATGHFQTLHAYEHSDDLHNLIDKVYRRTKNQIKKKYNLILRSEYKNGEIFEGFDLWVTGEEAKQIWDLFEFKKVLKINKEKELDEATEVYEKDYKYNQLPNLLKQTVNESTNNIVNSLKVLREKAYDRYMIDYSLENIDNLIKSMSNSSIHESQNMTLCGNDKYFESSISISPEFKIDNIAHKNIINGLIKFFNENTENDLYKLEYSEDNNCLQLSLSSDYGKKLYEHLEDHHYNNETFSMFESTKYVEAMKKAKLKKFKDIKMKSDDVVEALCEKLIESPTQTNLNTISNIFTEEFLPQLDNPFTKFKINLIDYPSPIFEVSINNINELSIKELLENKANMNDLIHADENTLTYNISSSSFKNESAKDIINFLKNSIQFYSEHTNSTVNNLIFEYKLLNGKDRFIIENTDLKGLLPMLIESLFIENGFSFKESILNNLKENNSTILSNYMKAILENNQYNENCQSIVNLIRDLNYDVYKQIKNVPVMLEKYHNNGLKDTEKKYKEFLEDTCVDKEWHKEKERTANNYLQEGFFSKVKKLKKFPSDLIAYITIETEAIKDYNDKLILASYTLGKIELVEWYASLLETGSKNYIVPYTKDQLQRLRMQLLNCYKKIMAVQIGNKNNPGNDFEEPYNY